MFLVSYFSNDGEPQKDVKIRVEQGLKTFGAMNMMFKVRNESLGVKRKSSERVILPTVMHGMTNWDIRIDESETQIRCYEIEVLTDYDVYSS